KIAGLGEKGLDLGGRAVVDGDAIALFGDVERKVLAHDAEPDQSDIRQFHAYPSSKRPSVSCVAVRARTGQLSVARPGKTDRFARRKRGTGPVTKPVRLIVVMGVSGAGK